VIALVKLLVLALVCSVLWCGCACPAPAADAGRDTEVDPGDAAADVHCAWDHAQTWHRDCCNTAECLGYDDPGGPVVTCVSPPASSRTSCQPHCAADGGCPSGLTCLEDGVCWAVCSPSPGVTYGCPGSTVCVPHGTATTAPWYVCQGARL
jgi:hypothetical protein